ncbi:hypothetical protein H310_07936 [Aphanomyces invadans]|uniref:Uncharacterized protein n=1 Tax=Aphanomyces invadans TaxID=157072 RepID=A0A024U0J5_9STRA|nr:hypothetical protein H310_07936 [Aphanomyces invadans]ETV99905.1 hypothetical protein H310_07936 [Aphanomyces invadans]|eukprot:XP_008871681.1 hypothetical protein H310_07936 [Aphanomyces invadans]
MDEAEIESLEVMAGFLSGLHETNSLLNSLNKQVLALSQELATAERNLSALSIPFRSTMYEIAMREEKSVRPAFTTNSPRFPVTS